MSTPTQKVQFFEKNFGVFKPTPAVTPRLPPKKVVLRVEGNLEIRLRCGEVRSVKPLGSGRKRELGGTHGLPLIPQWRRVS